MRKLLVICMCCIGLMGCVSSDPVHEMIQEQAIIGDWLFNGMYFNGRKVDGPLEDQIRVSFRADNSFNLMANDEQIFKEFYKTGSSKYTIKGNRLYVVFFDNNKYEGEYEMSFKIKNDKLSVSDIIIRGVQTGTHDFNKIKPDHIRTMALTFSKI